jgi:alkanesulfonate monooxygenase SsuD/methylene tetrahydromethanopterin reductase-like flavin-dependent oxidoreductase (luciferase family)
MVRSFGLPGATDVAMLRRLAPRIEAAGYGTLWLNDTDGRSLDALAAVAEVTARLGLATGVIAVDRMPPSEIAGRIRELGLPEERLRIGIGSGGARHGLGLLRDAVAALRAETGVPIVVGALGPRTRRLAAEIADGVLLSWLTPATARAAMADLTQASATGRTAGILYARTIADPAARPALVAEAARYAGLPSYAANFERLGVEPLDTTVDLMAPAGAPHHLAAFESEVDEMVLRAVTPAATEGEILRVIDAGAPSP